MILALKPMVSMEVVKRKDRDNDFMTYLFVCLEVKD